MLAATIVMVFVFIGCDAKEHYYKSMNTTRSTLSGLPIYRSSLAQDWLPAKVSRQRKLAAAYTDVTPFKPISSNCIAYPRPAAGKVGKLLLEVLKNLEGDDSTLVSELVQILLRVNILVDTSALELEPDLESLVKTPGMMVGEPHATFPRILAVVWILATDPATSGKHGWCFLNKVNQYLMTSKPREIAQQMKTIEPVLSRARFIMEEFIQNVTPLHMYQRKTTRKSVKIVPTEQTNTTTIITTSTKRHTMKQRASVKRNLPQKFQSTRPSSLSKKRAAKFNPVEVKQGVVNNSCSGIWTSRGYFLLFLILV